MERDWNPSSRKDSKDKCEGCYYLVKRRSALDLAPMICSMCSRGTKNPIHKDRYQSLQDLEEAYKDEAEDMI